MWTIICPLGTRRIVKDAASVKAAIEMNWIVYHNGKRVW